MESIPRSSPRVYRIRGGRHFRGALNKYVRRRTTALLALITLLAGIGVGIYVFTESRHEDALNVSSGPVTGPFHEADTTRLGTEMESSGVADLLPDLGPQGLTIRSFPDGAQVTITLQDGTSIAGATPFTQEIPGGQIQVECSKRGFNTILRTFTLTADTSLDLWLDPEGQLLSSLVRFECGPRPKQIAFSPDGSEIWVALLEGCGLEVFDSFTGTKLDEVRLGDCGAVELVFSRDGSTVYASQMETASVYEIDRATRSIRRQLHTGGVRPKVIVLSPDERILYASNWVSDDVSQIDLVTGELIRRIRTVDTPRGLYVTPDGSRLYVAGSENGEIQRIDLADLHGTVIFKTSGAMRHMVGDDTRGLLYVSDLSMAHAYVVDLATDKVTKLVDTDQRPNTMDLSPDGRLLFISNRGRDNPLTYLHPGPEWGDVLVVDAATGVILDAIVGGNQCTGLDVSPDGTLLAFTDFLDDTVRVYKIPDYGMLFLGGGGRAQQRFHDIQKE